MPKFYVSSARGFQPAKPKNRLFFIQDAVDANDAAVKALIRGYGLITKAEESDGLQMDMGEYLVMSEKADPFDEYGAKLSSYDITVINVFKAIYMANLQKKFNLPDWPPDGLM